VAAREVAGEGLGAQHLGAHPRLGPAAREERLDAGHRVLHPRRLRLERGRGAGDEAAVRVEEPARAQRRGGAQRPGERAQVLARVGEAHLDADEQVAAEQRLALGVPHGVVVGRVPRGRDEGQRRRVEVRRVGGDGRHAPPREVAVEPGRGHRAHGRARGGAHGERHPGGGEARRVAGVVLVVVGDHRPAHGAPGRAAEPGEVPLEVAPRGRQAGVDQDPAGRGLDEVRAHVVADEPAGARRQDEADDVAVRFDAKHAEFYAGRDPTTRAPAARPGGVRRACGPRAARSRRRGVAPPRPALPSEDHRGARPTRPGAPFCCPPPPAPTGRRGQAVAP
jgi:hypothetical protein